MYRSLMIASLSAAMISSLSAVGAEVAPRPEPAAPVVKSRIPVIYSAADPARVRLHGPLSRWLDSVNATFVKRPDELEQYLKAIERPKDRGAWTAEVIGKWMEAAGIMWRYTGDPEIKNLLDQAARRLIAAQSDRGYLGSYADGYRFYQIDWNKNRSHPGHWDLWCCWLTLEGLLNYHQTVGGHQGALDSARKLGDLIVETFGDGKQDITIPPHDCGQGPMSGLVAIVHLYEFTGDPRYLEFARYIMRQFGRDGTLSLKMAKEGDAPHYPFNPGGAVLKHAEFELSVRGVTDYYRLTGDPLAWRTSRNVYRFTYESIVGSMPLSGWAYPEGHAHQPTHRVGVETCDLVPLLRLLKECFRCSGDSRYLDDLEYLVYNHMCQLRDAQGCTTFTLPVDHAAKKWNRRDLDRLFIFHCCTSMGALGLADYARWGWFEKEDGILVNWYEPGSWQGSIASAPVRITCRGDFPYEDEISLAITGPKAHRFDLDLRIPRWCRDPKLTVNGTEMDLVLTPGKITTITREWNDGDRVRLALPMRTRTIRYGRKGFRVQRGPLLLCQPRQYKPTGDIDPLDVSPVVSTRGDIALEVVPDAEGTWQAAAHGVAWDGIKPTLTSTTMRLRSLFVEPGQFCAVFLDKDQLLQTPSRIAPDGFPNKALASNGTVARSSSEYVKEKGCTSEIIDGITDYRHKGTRNRWHSDLRQSLPQWVEVELKEVSTLNLVKIIFASPHDHPLVFRLDFYGTDSDKPVHTINEDSNQDPILYSNFLPAIEAKRVRLTVLRTTGTSEQIAELELY